MQTLTFACLALPFIQGIWTNPSSALSPEKESFMVGAKQCDLPMKIIRDEDLLATLEEETPEEKQLHANATADVKYIIGGAMKGGSTYLAKLMTMHPAIHEPSYGEVRFFAESYHMGLKWYINITCGATKPGQICGEKSPNYMISSTSIDRVAKHYPNMKWIVVLREPVSRIISQYKMYVRNCAKLGDSYHAKEGDLPRCNKGGSILEALQNEPYCLSEEEKKSSSVSKYYYYIQKGFYIDQLEYILKRFPRNQLKVILNDDMRDIEGFDQQSIWEYVGVDPTYRVELKSFFQAPKTQDEEKMPEEVVQQLQELYQPYNERLFRFLNRTNIWDYGL